MSSFLQSGVCCREKAVLVAIYTERPRRHLRLTGDRQHHFHHHYHHYHHFHQDVDKNGGRRRGYNRRAELLDYARHLRASSKPVARSASLSSDANSNIKQTSGVQIVAADRKLGRSSSLHPTCLGKWKSLIPSVLGSITALNNTNKSKGKKKSASTATKMKALVKRLQVQKKGSLLSKLLAIIRKRG